MRSNLPQPVLVGITGGIGSGKSIVCNGFATLGRAVISADVVARDLTNSNDEVRRAIAEEFGKDLFAADGTLDRKALATRAFASAERTALLNAIVHPHVFKAMSEMITHEDPARLRPYVILEAALIYESGMDEFLNRVIVVDAPEEERIRRVMARDRCDRESVVRRIAAQMPAQEKTRRADFVIVNDKNSVDLTSKIALLDIILRALPPDDLPDDPGESTP